MSRTRTFLCFVAAACIGSLPSLVSARAGAADGTEAAERHPSPPQSEAKEASPPAHESAAATSRSGAPTQALRVGDVLIEGKLYSPQALFILSRPEERFGRAVVVPQVLQLQRSSILLPYGLRPEVLEAHRNTGSTVKEIPLPADGTAGPPASHDVQGGRP